ncbi:Uncharacterised protein g9201 [Pycnogonum litorale]
MTKLLEWLAGLSLFLITWILLLSGRLSFIIPDSHLILFLPIYVAVIFAIYAASVITYRVFTFNDCFQASESLKREIIEAKADLKSIGFKFDNY